MKVPGNYTITVQGSEVTFFVDYYNPGRPAKTWGAPEDCYPADPDELEWYADTGNELFNELIQDNYNLHDEIYEKLVESIHEGGEESELERQICAQEDRDREDFLIRKHRV